VVENFLSREIITPKYSLGAKQVQERGERVLKQECEEVPEARKILESLDLDVVRDILIEKLKRAGLAQDQVNFISSARILFYKKFGLVQPHGAFEPVANMIAINYYRLLAISSSEIRSLMLRAAIHEEVHAVSRVVCRVDSYGDTEAVSLGLARQESGQRGNDFILLEEGITEKFAQEIFGEYNRRTGGEKVSGDLPPIEAYDLCVKLVDVVIGKISAKRQIPITTVWDAILEAKLRGRDLQEPELWGDLTEMFTPSVMEKIKKNRLKEAIDEIELGV
jgi:hypothetical protein